MVDEQNFVRRLQSIGILLILITLVTVGRLFWIQVIRHAHYAVLASEEQLRKLEVAPERGTIYLNSRGQLTPVAMNRDLKRVYADGRYIDDPVATAKQLAKLLKIDTAALLEQLKSDSAYIVLKRGLDPLVAKAIDQLELAGIGLQDEPVRTYPEGNLAAHVLGFVNGEGDGQYGVEEQYNQVLTGQRGLLKAITDVRGIPIATSDNFQIAPRRGSDVVLTIERNLQAKVESVLKAGMSRFRAKAASAVVMDPNSGAVLAMANYPSYDPAKFNQVTDYGIFTNRVVNHLYEPGSVIKIFAMAAGLERGAVSPSSTYRDYGSVTIDGYKIENAAGIPTGVHSMREVIAHSINSGVIHVLKQMGGGDINRSAKDALYDYFKNRFRLDQPTGIDLPSEAATTLNDPATTSDVGYANMTFGQGLSATMLQVAAAYGALANGGTFYEPYIMERTIDPNGQVNQTQPQVKATGIVGQPVIDQLEDMMVAVINEGGGFEAAVPGYRVGGKSGTAQLANPAGGYFTNRDIGSFVGLVPLGDTKLVMMIRVDEPAIGLFASVSARTMWGEIARWSVNYLGIAPRR